MEKLIELLNEYDWYSIEYSWEWFIQNGKTISMVRKFEDCPWFTYYENWDSNLISKQFWFIKWLVENDKIDLDMIPNVFTSSAQDRDEVYYCMMDIKDFSILNEQYWKPTIECLLMILSIQDNPIEFLVKILK
jgi:hypothetical protein